jgi:hypothetical protein
MRSPPERRFYQLEKFLKFIEDLRNVGNIGLPVRAYAGPKIGRIPSRCSDRARVFEAG